MDKLPVLVLITSLASAMEDAKTENVDAFESEIISQYPGYFRTEEEAKVMEYHLQNINRGRSKGMKAQARSKGMKAQAREVYHACCSSTDKAVTYDTLLDVYGSAFTLVVFQNRKQYFPSETCTTLPNCVSCRCRCDMAIQLFTALVYNPDYPSNSSEPTVLKLVQAPTFCRCFNNLMVSKEPRDDEDGPEMMLTSHDTEL